MAVSVSLLSRRLAVTPTLPARRGRRALVARAHSDDDEPLPLLRLPRQEVDLKKMAKLKPTPSLGGATIGDELALIYRQHQSADARAKEAMEKGLYSSNWAGDVYIGGRWNVLSVLYLIFLATPIAGLLFAYLTYGSLWGVMPGTQLPGF